MDASPQGARATAMFLISNSDAATGMAGRLKALFAFGNATANTFEGALLAVREIFRAASCDRGSCLRGGEPDASMASRPIAEWCDRPR